MNESEKIKFERWVFIQEITPEDIANVIQGSEALCHAIRSNHWTDVAEIIKTRIEALAQRIAESCVLGDVKSSWIDDVQELEEYQLRQIERQQQALERQKKAITNKLALDDDELNLHETNIQLINALKRYVKTDMIIGSVDNAIYKDAKALLESLGEM